ncbi:MAG: bifunctional adenosylcobinamide kinase/adenosylcobinamide-phosphate guanylyltransferase [Eubacteriales bacterium]|nr:bifunctional adenosylcobinamide kinase/adenosylcobinamide-phosphate guanylyltransferase [Eubacteriales bacterium]
MELYIGGYAQGKLNYVKKKYGLHDIGMAMKQPTDVCNHYIVLDGETLECKTEAQRIQLKEMYGDQMVILNHFHLWVKKELLAGENVTSQMDMILELFPNLVIISDELGNGIVPMEKQDRVYRETTGRCLVSLAASAKRVERIFCGIGQVLKSEK